jgi:hypothetical protein
MASVFKKSRDKGKKNKPWWIEYTDANGERAYSKGFTDKGLTEQLAAKLENEVAHVTNPVVGPFQPRADLFSWPSGLLLFISSEPTSWTSRSST